MGNCFGSSSGSGSGGGGGSSSAPSRKELQLRQQTNWKATGLVGLRDQGLREFPSALAEAGAAVKVVDASNNKLTDIPDYFATFANLQRLVRVHRACRSPHGVLGVHACMRVRHVPCTACMHQLLRAAGIK